MYTVHLLGINLVVFDFQEKVIYCGTHQTERAKSGPTFLLAWIGHSHFEPIFEVRESADGERAAFGTFFYDDAVLQHVLGKYKAQGCPRVSLYKILSLKHD